MTVLCQCFLLQLAGCSCSCSIPGPSLQDCVQVVEHLVSPHGIQQIDWSARSSRDASRPPSWHAWQTPASFQSPAGTAWPDKPVITHSGHHTPSTGILANDAQVLTVCMQLSGAYGIVQECSNNGLHSVLLELLCA